MQVRTLGLEEAVDMLDEMLKGPHEQQDAGSQVLTTGTHPKHGACVLGISAIGSCFIIVSA